MVEVAERTIKTQPLKGRVAVVTGAGSGIGAALADRLAASGVKLGLGSRRPERHRIAGALEVSCDVRDYSQVAALVEATVERFGALDMLVACAGVGAYHAFLDTPMEQVNEMLDTNVKGTVHFLRAGLPHLVGRGEGDVIIVASEAGRRGMAGQAVYSATKFAQVGLARALDNELREHNVRCSVVCPGGVATRFAMEEGWGRKPESLAGMMTADDVADVIMFTLTRPRHLRLLEVALRPLGEASRG